jgi:hypothetical protein
MLLGSNRVTGRVVMRREASQQLEVAPLPTPRLSGAARTLRAKVEARDILATLAWGSTDVCGACMACSCHVRRQGWGACTHVWDTSLHGWLGRAASTGTKSNKILLIQWIEVELPELGHRAEPPAPGLAKALCSHLAARPHGPPACSVGSRRRCRPPARWQQPGAPWGR